MFMFDYRGLVLVFVITALFDVLINILPQPFGAAILKDYFKNHTLLSAALIAGFVGAVTFIPITMLIDYNVPNIKNMLIIFMISALIGFPMELSNMFPVLQKYYYDRIPRYQSFLADGVSGIMVASIYWLLILSRDKKRDLLTRLIPIWVIIFFIYLLLLYFNVLLF